MKTQSQGPGHSQPQSHPQTHPHPATTGALEEKITHLTEEAAKTANRFKVPILVAIVAVIAIVAVSGLVSTITRQQDAERSEKLYLLFQNDAARIRAEGPALQKEFEGTRIEPAFVSRYAHWLYDQNQPGDREQAFALVAAARARHPESLILELTGSEFEQVRTASEGFVLPSLPPPPAPAGTETPGAAPTGTPPAGTTPVEPGAPPPSPAPPAEDSAGGTAPPPAPGQAPGSGGR